MSLHDHWKRENETWMFSNAAIAGEIVSIFFCVWEIHFKMRFNGLQLLLLLTLVICEFWLIVFIINLSFEQRVTSYPQIKNIFFVRVLLIMEFSMFYINFVKLIYNRKSIFKKLQLDNALQQIVNNSHVNCD